VLTWVRPAGEVKISVPAEGVGKPPPWPLLTRCQFAWRQAHLAAGHYRQNPGVETDLAELALDFDTEVVAVPHPNPGNSQPELLNRDTGDDHWCINDALLGVLMTIRGAWHAVQGSGQLGLRASRPPSRSPTMPEAGVSTAMPHWPMTAAPTPMTTGERLRVSDPLIELLDRNK
jgi:hypothetical protein